MDERSAAYFAVGLSEVSGEPVVLSEKRPLMLLSATRLSKEKG